MTNQQAVELFGVLAALGLAVQYKYDTIHLVMDNLGAIYQPFMVGQLPAFYRNNAFLDEWHIVFAGEAWQLNSFMLGLPSTPQTR